MANPRQQGLKPFLRLRYFLSLLAAMANPRQQGLKPVELPARQIGGNRRNG